MPAAVEFDVSGAGDARVNGVYCRDVRGGPDHFTNRDTDGTMHYDAPLRRWRFSVAYAAGTIYSLAAQPDTHRRRLVHQPHWRCTPHADSHCCDT